MKKLPQVLSDIGNEALKKYKLHSISITHRKGTVLPGEIVCIYATSAHRAEAFAGCSWTIDELKRQAPIWKKEITQSGSYWIEGLAEPSRLSTSCLSGIHDENPMIVDITEKSTIIRRASASGVLCVSPTVVSEVHKEPTKKEMLEICIVSSDFSSKKNPH